MMMMTVVLKRKLFLLIILFAFVKLTKTDRIRHCEFKAVCGSNTYRTEDIDHLQTTNQTSGLQCVEKCANIENCYGANVCQNGNYVICDIIISNTINGNCVWLENRDGCKYYEMTSCDSFTKCGMSHPKSASNDVLWIERMRNDDSGNVISGSVTDLISAIDTGNDVRVIIQGWDAGSILRVNGQIYAWSDVHVCIQSLLNGYTDGEKVYRRFLSVCSSGQIQLQDYELQNPTRVRYMFLFHSMIWFTQCKAELVYSCSTYGDPITGNVNELILASESGFDFIIRNNALNYSMKALNSKAYSNSEASFQTIWQMTRPNLYSLKNPPQWYVPVITYAGRYNIVRWSPEKNLSSTSTSSGRYSTKWHVLKEWQLVFSNSHDGEKIYGEKVTLFGYIQTGHRVKVKIQNKTEEAKSIRLKNGDIWAELLESLEQINEETIGPNVTRYFRIISTSGMYRIYTYHVCCGFVSLVDSYNQSAHWYTDRREWSNVYTFNNFNSSNSTADLVATILKGETIRIGHLYDDVSLYLDVENIEITSGNEVIATSTINIEPLHDPDLGYVLNPTSYWKFIFTSSNGNVTIGNAGKLGNVSTVWFTSN